MTTESLHDSEYLGCRVDNGICTLSLQSKNAKMNTLSKGLLLELEALLPKIAAKNPKGLIIETTKDSFAAGADITEFLGFFGDGSDKLNKWLRQVHTMFDTIEDFPFPTVACIKGTCLGGGTELVLACDYRIGTDTVKIGLPEVKLGIFPGWGGTVRLPRLIGIDNALEWIALGSENKADAALKVGVLDAIVADDQLHAAAVTMIEKLAAGQLPKAKRNQEKTSPVPLRSPVEAAMIFEGAKGLVLQQTKGHYPAPLAAIEAMQKTWHKGRAEASQAEIDGFVKVAHTPVADSLVSIFLADQQVKKANKSLSGAKTEVAAVIGAGIMGGGIAYQSAKSGVPIVMKDIQRSALDLGMNEAIKILESGRKRGKLSPREMASTVGLIAPTLDNQPISACDFVVEAVVENPKVKKAVLGELEGIIPAKAVLSSNTSTISIDELAADLKRPEQFCGMHFFNPVHRMPLVEIIRGSKTSEDTIARTVTYAYQLGKKPIVVNDCPGFLVNRILFPYLTGLMNLIGDGIDFQYVDKVMEKFGWPMGPAYLLDVVGMDTGVHALNVLMAGYPGRFRAEDAKGITALVAAKRLGQKTGKGFYSYSLDRRGKPKKSHDEGAYAKLYDGGKPKDHSAISPEDIVRRMMYPLLTESVLCLEEKIAATPQEIDLALIYGIGFPPFRGGAFKYLDSLTAAKVVEELKPLASYGKVYEAPAMLTDFADSGKSFCSFSQQSHAVVA